MKTPPPLPPRGDKLSHDSLVLRGASWLQRVKHCEPVLYGLASGSEIPDAIGWQAADRGSIVLECKTSRSDLLRDARKYRRFVSPDGTASIPLATVSQEYEWLRAEHGYTEREVLRMGDYRWIVCPAELLSPADVARYAPEHGLLWADGSTPRLTVALDAPRRPAVNHRAEVRHLRMALIHVGYNVRDHGFDVHMPTLTKWGGRSGMKPRTPPAVL